MLMSDEEQSITCNNGIKGNQWQLHRQSGCTALLSKEEQFFYQCNMEKKELLKQDVASCLHEHLLF